jgi:hypothetical protein
MSAFPVSGIVRNHCGGMHRLIDKKYRDEVLHRFAK